MTDSEERCERCRRPAPPWESPDYASWEAVEGADGEIGAICPGCFTGEEEQALLEAWEEVERSLAACTRCGTPAPEGDPEEDGWRLFEDRLLCPGCTTPDDIRQNVRMLNQAAARLEKRSDRR
jgi:Zn ribbon nucleic-acid-binding protein